MQLRGSLVSSGGITFFVDRLAAKGLVERRSDVCARERRILREDGRLALANGEVIQDAVDRDSRSAHTGLPTLTSRVHDNVFAPVSGILRKVARNLSHLCVVRRTPASAAGAQTVCERSELPYSPSAASNVMAKRAASKRSGDDDRE